MSGTVVVTLQSVEKRDTIKLVFDGDEDDPVEVDADSSIENRLKDVKNRRGKEPMGDNMRALMTCDEGTLKFLDVEYKISCNKEAKTNKRKRNNKPLKLLDWEQLKGGARHPTKLLRPVLVEEREPPDFVAPAGWLKDLMEIVNRECYREDTELPRVSPVAFVRCSRGGKTRTLHELAWALIDEKRTPARAIIYVSFNGQTQLLAWEKQRPLEALCRRILYVALGMPPRNAKFREFALKTQFEEKDVLEWLGQTNCILLIDELNLLEATMDADFAMFLKNYFLLDSGRGLVFSSHVVTVNNLLTKYMHSPINREVKVKKLPIARDLSLVRQKLNYHALTPHMAVFLGLIPALYYSSKEHGLPHQRCQHAIQMYLDAGVTKEKVETLLITMLTGTYALVPRVFLELMDIDIGGTRELQTPVPTALWIPYHMSEVVRVLSGAATLSPSMRDCLYQMHEQFENFRTHKIKAGDGWEALFIVVLLVRCLTKSFCDLVKLQGVSADVEVFWNQPFDDKVDFGCESVQAFVDGIPFRHKKSISLYYPANSSFEAYDVILAYWGDNGQRQLYGYQLKEGSEVPKAFAMEEAFVRSYLIRGKSAKKDQSVRRWKTPGKDAIDKFFGVTAKNWAPQRWEELRDGPCPTCMETEGPLAGFDPRKTF